MKRKTVDSSLERQFLIGLITSKPFLASAAAVIDVGLLQTAYVKRIASWALDYFARYKDAPGREIEPLYHAWVENDNPEEVDSDAIRAFLESMSAEFDTAPIINVPYLLDELSKYLTIRRLATLNDHLTSALAYGDQESAISAVQSFRTVNLNDGIGYLPLLGRAVIRETYAEGAESLFSFSGDAGTFFNQALTRDALIGIQGPEKRGKTFWCLELAFRALRNRRTVAMFEVGDLTKAQLNRRLDVRTAGVPLWEPKDGIVRIPMSLSTTQDPTTGKDEPVVEYEDKKFARTIDAQAAYEGHKLFRRRLRLSGKELMFSVHANSSINVARIDQILQRWRHELDFVPDVIVIDYADILAPEDPRKEVRHQVNDTWKALRRLSQDWHACVIVPTQANALSYDTKTQSMKNFSEDKRKYAHVTAMLGLNQTSKEKEDQVMRLNWILIRESESNVKRCLIVTQCLALGQAMRQATFLKGPHDHRHSSV